MNSTNITRILSPATPRPVSRAPRVWAGCVLLASSLVLVGFAGCFLIGVLGVVRPELFLPIGVLRGAPAPAALSNAEWTLMVTLYGFAFASLLGAVVLFILGVRGLWPVLRYEGPADEN